MPKKKKLIQTLLNWRDHDALLPGGSKFTRERGEGTGMREHKMGSEAYLVAGVTLHGDNYKS